MSVSISALIVCLGAAGAFAHGGHFPSASPSCTPTATPTPGFSNANLKGTYALSFSGTIAGTGTLVADGKGNVTGGETYDDGTNVCTGTIAGTYSVNSDGTGTATVNFTTSSTGTVAGTCPTSPVTVNIAVVIVSRGHVKLSGTNPGYVETGSLELQHEGFGKGML